MDWLNTLVQPRRCHLCGQRIWLGVYHVYQPRDKAKPGLVVCASCERTRPHCIACGVPVGRVTPNAGEPVFCDTCLAHLPRCVACGRPIVGAVYIAQGDDRRPFCEDCRQDRARCDICGVPVGAGSYRLHDGRYICARCHQTAVYDDATAQALYQRVISVVEGALGLTLSLRPGLALVDRDQLRALLSQQEPGLANDPDKVLGLFMRRGRRRAIYVESGLPYILLTIVTAHEYAHAWQGENCPLLKDPLLREGFAEWVAYKTLEALGATKKMAQMRRRTDLYGQGLEHVLEIEGRGGPAAVVYACRTSHQ